MEVAVAHHRVLVPHEGRVLRQPGDTAFARGLSTAVITGPRRSNHRSTSAPSTGNGQPETGIACSRTCSAASSRKRAGAAHGARVMTASSGSPGTRGRTIHGSSTGLLRPDRNHREWRGDRVVGRGDELQDRVLELQDLVFIDRSEDPQRELLPPRRRQLVTLRADRTR